MRISSWPWGANWYLARIQFYFLTEWWLVAHWDPDFVTYRRDKGLRKFQSVRLSHPDTSHQSCQQQQSLLDFPLNFFNAAQTSSLISIWYNGIVAHDRIQKKGTAVITPHHKQEVHLHWILGGGKSARATYKHCSASTGFAPVEPYVQTGVHHHGTTIPAGMPYMLFHPLMLGASKQQVHHFKIGDLSGHLNAFPKHLWVKLVEDET